MFCRRWRNEAAQSTISPWLERVLSRCSKKYIKGGEKGSKLWQLTTRFSCHCSTPWVTWHVSWMISSIKTCVTVRLTRYNVWKLVSTFELGLLKIASQGINCHHTIMMQKCMKRMQLKHRPTTSVQCMSVFSPAASVHSINITINWTSSFSNGRWFKH